MISDAILLIVLWNDPELTGSSIERKKTDGQATIEADHSVVVMQYSELMWKMKALW